MAQFFAKIKGARGPATRLGHKTSGIQCEVLSWAGMITVDMWHDSTTERDMVRVTFGPHCAAAGRMVLYHGPCEGWQDYHERGRLGRDAWHAANRNTKAAHDDKEIA